MACKLTDYENEMVCLRILLHEVESSGEEIDQASENESDGELYSSHNSEFHEFEQNDNDYEKSDSLESNFFSKNKTVYFSIFGF